MKKKKMNKQKNMVISYVPIKLVPRINYENISPLRKALLELPEGKVLHIQNIRCASARRAAIVIGKERQKFIHCRIVKEYPNEAWYWLEGTKINHCK